MKNTEIEVRFLNIDKKLLVDTLRSLNAKEEPEQMIEEIIFYDPELKWRDVDKRFVRIRKIGDRTLMTYKHNTSGSTLTGVEEIEFHVPDIEKASLFVQRLGLIPYRHQQKLRHSFLFDGASIDMDTWPTVPSYIEIEGSSEEQLRKIASLLNLAWDNVITEDAREVLQKYYNIPMSTLRIFRFDKIE